MQCKKGTLLISFDCEGKWGMADHLNAYHETHFTNTNIARAYTQILAALKRHEIPATFAFVSAFTQSPEAFRKHRELFYDTPESYKNWMAKFYKDMSNGIFEGWFCPAPLDMVAEDGRHEIGSHSCFHRAFSEGDFSLQDAAYDFRASRVLLADKGHKPNTFIYPRNVVGHTSLLKEYGYIGYRHGTAYKTDPLSRALNLLREFHLLDTAEPPLPNNADGLTVIPAGYFFNWPHGLRRAVPNTIVRLRWQRIIKNAITTRRVAHLWFHPHNFIQHPAMLENFAAILSLAAHYRDRGELSIMTMHDYCKQAAS